MTMDREIIAAVVEYVETSQKVIAKLLEAKGDTSGHEFHGNRYTGGIGGGLETNAIKHFGLTDIIHEAGYVTPSGKLLDFSGRHYSGGYHREGDRNVPDKGQRDYFEGQRNVDHREVPSGEVTLEGGNEAMRELQEGGFVRVQPTSGELAIEITKPMTDEQVRAVVSGFADMQAHMESVGQPGVGFSVSVARNVGSRTTSEGERVTDFDPIHDKYVPNASRGTVAKMIREANSVAEGTTKGFKGDITGHGFHGNRYTGGIGGGEQTTPIHVSTIDEAVRLLGAGKGIMFERPEQAVTLLHELSRIAQEAKAAGTKAPNYDLCKVSVTGTNLFCAQNVGIPRSAMPQLQGKPLPGSPADSLPKDAKGEVNLGPAFRDYLAAQGHTIEDVSEQADRLRASQTEMAGAKVGGMMEAMEAGKLAPASIFVSADNYVIDGHHRWAATVGLEYAKNEKLSMPVARLDMKILPALAAANAFATSMGIPQSDVTKAFFAVLDVKAWA